MGGNGYPPNLCNKLENNPNNQDLKIVSEYVLIIQNRHVITLLLDKYGIKK